MNGKTRYQPGPALLVTAAFIGPGTVTTATLAGNQYGFALLWALLFATIATIILQNMAGTVGMVRGQGLAEAMLATSGSVAGRIIIALLLLVALAVGNAAYEAGNIAGAVIGFDLLFGDAATDRSLSVGLIAILAMIALLWPGRKALIGLLTALVLVMSLAFLATAILSGVDLQAFIRGFLPVIPQGGTLTAIALIGTTIVPYNLFLHAALARQRWPQANTEALCEMRNDTIGAVTLGGIVSIAILSTAATHFAAHGVAIDGPADLALQLEPLAGAYAPLLLGTGLFAAGLTSAITAPLATGIIVTEIASSLFALSADKAWVERIVALTIVCIGAIIAISGTSIIAIIVTAQAANGLLLPVVAIMLYRLHYHGPQAVAGKHVTRLAGLLVIVIASLLGSRLIARSLGIWG
ncbi:MAG: divalent metal cation transporter [Pseudomonadota bacterium]